MKNILTYSQKSVINQIHQCDQHIIPKRELECAVLLADGYTSKEIAAQLNLSSRTIEVYVERLKAKFSARNKPHLVKLMMEVGVISRENLMK